MLLALHILMEHLREIKQYVIDVVNHVFASIHLTVTLLLRLKAKTKHN